MWIFLVFCLIVVLVIRWAILRDRMARMASSISELRERVDAQAQTLAELYRERRKEPVVSEPVVARPAPVAAAAPPPPPRPEPLPEPVPAPPIVAPKVREWETVLGGNWLNKLGVFVLVIGLALLLRYSFTQLGPAGRVAISLAASFALLAAGALIEAKERYRIFARGLLGGGWAALYVTVYAMHAIDAAKVIDSAAVGAVLLLVVAIGMIVHSLRYRSQTVTGLAYFVAFGTLAITSMATLSFLALVPLAASLLYVAHRFSWIRMTLFGLVATYGVVVLRGDTGAPLWQAQAIFAVYWLLFEIFDVLHPEAWLLPLNAAGALGLSVLKWQSSAPDRLWMLLSAAAVLYLVSALARVRKGKWHGAATLTAMLAAGAIFRRLDQQWVATGLAVEAEIVYLAGLRLRAPYLRWLGTSLFGIEALRLVVSDIWALPAGEWVPVASLDAVVFYVNRALYAADQFYGFAAAGMVALVTARKMDEPWRSVVWQAEAAAAFAFGWWRKLFDFRLQGYLLLFMGLAGTAATLDKTALGVAAGICYGAVLCALWSGADRLGEQERGIVRVGGASACVIALMALVWRLVPGEYLGIAWMALAVVALELGLRKLPDEFRILAYTAALAGAVRVALFNLIDLHNTGPWDARLMPAWAALLSYVIAVRSSRDGDDVMFTVATCGGMAFGVAALWALLPIKVVAMAWAGAAVLLLLAARQWKRQVLAGQSYVLAALACGLSVINVPDGSAVWPDVGAIACFYAGQFLSKRDSVPRLYFSIMATTLTTLLLGFRISGSMLTVACGIQGVILLASGFPLRDRVLRISGLALLLACILKLFVWDLRHLDTLPRILSFIVLGMILLGVSWIYTRFRERVARLL